VNGAIPGGYARNRSGITPVSVVQLANPGVLLVHTIDWPNVARLALSFRANRCRVYVLCRDDHPARRLSVLDGSFGYRRFAPLRSLRKAIEAAAPDLIIPCDDLAVEQILELYYAVQQGPRLDKTVKALIETSLGNPEGYRLASRRSELPAIAASAGVPLPPTSRVSSPEELLEWLARNGVPAFLKVDHSCGGAGVLPIDTIGEAEDAYYRLASPQVARSIKRLVWHQEPERFLRLLRGQWPVLSVQAAVPGGPANCAVACWQGEIVAGIAVGAIVTNNPTGTATVIRVIDSAEMFAIAGPIVRRLGVSGFFGFDFIIEPVSGRPHLIEINPRATQINHLALGAGRDLTAALRARFCDEPVREAPPVTDQDTIALFPQEWRRDPRSPFLATAYHDIPHDAPDLIRAEIDGRSDPNITESLGASRGRS
jgi:ATP-grasp domain